MYMRIQKFRYARMRMRIFKITSARMRIFCKKTVFQYKLHSMSLCGKFIIHWHRPHGRDGNIVPQLNTFVTSIEPLGYECVRYDLCGGVSLLIYIYIYNIMNTYFHYNVNPFSLP